MLLQTNLDIDQSAHALHCFLYFLPRVPQCSRLVIDAGQQQFRDKMVDDSFGRALRNLPEKAKRLLLMQFQRAWNMYSGMLIDDPAISTRLEALLRVLSYVVPGRFVASQEIGELLYSSSNLLALLHDYIFRSHITLPKLPGTEAEKRLLMYLSVIESVEVFFEMTAHTLWDDIGKWLIVLLIQLSKVGIRLLLLLKNQPKLQKYPLIPLLNRQLVAEGARKQNIQTEKEETFGKQDGLGTPGEDHVWQGERSGRYIRSLSSTPPNGFRSWKLPKFPVGRENPTVLNNAQFYAEILHVIRPLLHMTSMFAFGEKSWKPWLLSLFTDTASLAIHTRCNRRLTSMEKTEISRRLMLLLLYLLRSPFYDNHSKVKILFVMNGLANRIPLISYVIRPLLQYLPWWQRTYFYNWCT